jgi:hypothetical protein
MFIRVLRITSFFDFVNYVQCTSNEDMCVVLLVLEVRIRKGAIF